MSNPGPRLAGKNVPHHLIWGGVIIGFLVMQIVMSGIAVFLATSDDATAIEPNYSAKALHWDDQVAAQRASDSLGWQANLVVSAQPDVLGHRLLQLSLVNALGKPVDKANVTVTVFPHAHGSQTQALSLAEAADVPGVYSAEVTMKKSGWWEFRVSAVKGTDTFQQTVKRDIP